MTHTPEDIEAIGERIAQSAARIDAATHSLLTDIRAFDLAQGWAAQGALSCAQWLGWRIGLSLGPAREKLRVAHALAELPEIDAALARGEISYSKVRALSRVASPENERLLLEMARSATASQLERIVRLYRRSHPETPPSLEDRWVCSRVTQERLRENRGAESCRGCGGRYRTSSCSIVATTGRFTGWAFGPMWASVEPWHKGCGTLRLINSSRLLTL